MIKAKVMQALPFECWLSMQTFNFSMFNRENLKSSYAKKKSNCIATAWNHNATANGSNMQRTKHCRRKITTFLKAKYLQYRNWTAFGVVVWKSKTKIWTSEQRWIAMQELDFGGNLVSNQLQSAVQKKGNWSQAKRLKTNGKIGQLLKHNGKAYQINRKADSGCYCTSKRQKAWMVMKM